MELPLGQMEASFYRPERDAALARDFALAHAFEERQVDDFLLSFGQELNHARKQIRQIAVLELVRRCCDLVGERIIDIFF